MIDVARPQGWLIALAHGSFMRAIALVHAGQIRDAEADARLAFDFKLATAPGRVIWALFPLVDALRSSTSSTTPTPPWPPAGYSATRRRAPSPSRCCSKAAPACGSPSTATPTRTTTFAAAGSWRELGVRHPASPPGASTPPRRSWRSATSPSARRLAEEHLELAGRVDLPGPRGAGLRALSRASEREEAIVLLGQAVDLLAGPRPSSSTRARSSTSAPRCAAPTAAPTPSHRCATRSTSPTATACAGSPAARATSCAPPAPGPAAARSPASTRSPRPSTASPRSPPRGHSNREIAQQLYVTRRTVETHLTHAFQKLDITTRDELAACLAGGHETRAAMREPAVAG